MEVPEEPTAPLIFVDTSEPALTAEGLVDATTAVRAPMKTKRRVVVPPQEGGRSSEHRDADNTDEIPMQYSQKLAVVKLE
jgi:hypothetical protein